ncbi:MAG: hypothetical protein ACK506_18995 [Pirellula sp.]
MSQTAICLDYVPDSSDFTETRYIAPRERLHSGVFVTFRPCDIMQRATLLEVRNRTGNEIKFLEILIRELTKRVTQWSLTMPSVPTDLKSEPIPMPIEEKYVRSLRPVLLNRMLDIVVWSADGGDVPPDGEQSVATTDEFESRIQAMLSQSAAS